MARLEPTDRLSWAVSTLEVRSRDRVLEIGCGHGVAVSLVCEQLTAGRIDAIDRSQKMIDAAKKRNAEHVATGKATFQRVALRDFDPGAERFDKVFGVHIGGVLRRGGDQEYDVIRTCLARGGWFFRIDQPLDPSTADEAARETAAELEAHGFAIERVIVEPVARAIGVSVGARIP